jgi:hypothetical protein
VHFNQKVVLDVKIMVTLVLAGMVAIIQKIDARPLLRRQLKPGLEVAKNVLEEFHKFSISEGTRTKHPMLRIFKTLAKMQE